MRYARSFGWLRIQRILSLIAKNTSVSASLLRPILVRESWDDFAVKLCGTPYDLLVFQQILWQISVKCQCVSDSATLVKSSKISHSCYGRFMRCAHHFGFVDVTQKWCRKLRETLMSVWTLSCFPNPPLMFTVEYHYFRRAGRLLQVRRFRSYVARVPARRRRRRR